MSTDSVISYVKDNSRVNDGVRFDDKYGGRPFMHVKEKEGRVRIKCEMMGRPTKDNGFLDGTVFRGKIKERNGVTTISGIITTSFIYHLIMILMSVFLFYQMFTKSAYGLIPIFVFVVAFELMFFRDEFKKQGYIKRYLMRAVSRLEKESQNKV